MRKARVFVLVTRQVLSFVSRRSEQELRHTYASLQIAEGRNALWL